MMLMMSIGGRNIRRPPLLVLSAVNGQNSKLSKFAFLQE